MLIAHFADTHLGAKPYGYTWFYQALLDHFEAAVERALEEHVDAVVIAGDVFDKPRPPNMAIKRLIDVAAKIVEKGARLYVVLGEHDLVKTGSDIVPELLVPGIRILGYGGGGFRDCFSAGGSMRCIAGVSHHPLKYGEALKKRLLARMREAVRGLGRHDVLVLHQNIVNFHRFEPGLGLDDIPGEPGYIAMGHLHRRIVHRFGDGRLLAYAGGLEALKRDEVEAAAREGRGFYLVDTSGDEAEASPVDVEIVPQAVVSTRYERMAAEVAEAAKRLPRDRDSVLHAIIELETGVEQDIYRVLRSIVRRYSQRIHLRIHRVYRDPAITVSDAGVEGIDEAMVLAEMLGGARYRGLAEKILALKELLLMGGGWEDVDRLLSEIAGDRYWDTRVASLSPSLPSPREIRVGAAESGGRGDGRRPGRGRGLLSFLGEG